MVKERLPFELDRPNPSTPVADASAIDLNGQPLDNAVPEISDSDSDLDITDENQRAIVRLANGHIKTKYFDSSVNSMSAEEKTKLSGIEIGAEVNDVETSTSSDSDLDITDENGNVLAKFEGGHLKTKHFDSSTDILTNAQKTKLNGIEEGAEVNDVKTEANNKADFDITDENENILVRFKDGHIRTKYFDSTKILDYPSFKYQGKIVSILGDSISTYGVPDSRNQDGTYCHSYYPTETCRYSASGNVTEEGTTYQSIKFNVNDTWWMRLINNMGAILGCNESWRGSRVCGSDSNIFASQTRINHLGENGSPNMVVVYGGTNDAGATKNMTPQQVEAFLGTFNTENPASYTDEQIAALPVTTFADAYRTMLIRLQKTYPEAEIVVVLPTFTTTYYTITNLDLVVEIIKEACDFFGVKYIDIRTCGITCFNKATYLVDGIHPNANGMKLIADKIFKNIIYC